MTMIRIAALGIALAALTSGPAYAGSKNTITVRVSAFRSIRGSLRCRLYSRGDGFPGKPPFEAERSVAVAAKTMSCVFTDVVPGTYAVALFHDENDDGKLDTNFIGIPKEGVGVSNNKLRSLGPPTWDDAKFSLGSDLKLDVTLRY
jgi:uncharacterized protein (DUF2141 family)